MQPRMHLCKQREYRVSKRSLQRHLNRMRARCVIKSYCATWVFTAGGSPVTTDLGGDLCGRGCGSPTYSASRSEENKKEKETKGKETKEKEEVAGIRAAKARKHSPAAVSA